MESQTVSLTVLSLSPFSLSPGLACLALSLCRLPLSLPLVQARPPLLALRAVPPLARTVGLILSLVRHHRTPVMPLSPGRLTMSPTSLGTLPGSLALTRLLSPLSRMPRPPPSPIVNSLSPPFSPNSLPWLMTLVPLLPS